MNAPKIPLDGAEANILEYLRDHARYVEIQLKSRTPDLVAKHSTILLSPDGSAWEIKVDDTGVVTSTKVFDNA